MQAHHRKRVELKSLVIWKLFNTYDSWQSAVKEVSGHKGESRTTSPVCDALAGRIRRTTAQLRVSLSWSWEHQGALQPLPLLQTFPSKGACQWVPKTNCNPKSGCCGGATWGRVGGQLHPTSCFAGASLSAGTAPAWLCPCSPARARGLGLSLGPQGSTWHRCSRMHFMGRVWPLDAPRCCPAAPDSLPERKQPADSMMMPKIRLWLHGQLC